MDYLNKAKNLAAEKANSERQKGRMAIPDPEQIEADAEDNFIIGPAPGSSLPAEQPTAPAQPAQTQEPSPEDPKPKSPSQSKSGEHKTAKNPEKKPKKPAGEDEAEADKEKYSIYLPKKLSLSLRMVSIITRKKYSHVVESALSDMMYRRYQCHAPNCNTRFSISEDDKTPACCPVCGGKTIYPLRIDSLE